MSTIETLSYNELLEKAQKKKKEMNIAKGFLDIETNLDSIITINPSKELSLAEHYNSISGVELDSDITTFWEAQNSEINKLDMETPKNEYLSAFRDLQDILEASDEKDRQYTGSNSLKIQEKEAKNNIKEAKKSLAEQQKKYQETITTSNPFKMLLEFTFGDSTESDKIKSAEKSLESAKKGVKSAEKSLENIKERKKTLQESKDKLRVKEYMAREKMSDALQKIYENKVNAEKINDQSEKIQYTLKKQYDIIDKLTAIQALKKQTNYPSIRTVLNAQNPGLVAELDNIPDSLPDNTMRVSLTNPLTLSAIQIDTNKISEIEQKITETKNKLPNGININNLDNKINDLSTDKNNLSTEIANFELKDSDKIQDLESLMSNIPDNTSNEYKTLEMKKNHLVLKDNIKATQDKITLLENEIVNNENNPNLQDKIDKLNLMKDHLNILKEKLQNDPYSKKLSNLKELYSKTNSDLEELQKFQKKFQTLQSEKKYFEAPRNLTHIDSITQQLENSNLRFSHMPNTISDIFNLIQESIKNSKENLPMPTRRQPTRTGPTGPTR